MNPWSAVGGSPIYRSAPQAITFGAAITLTHGLGAAPSSVRCWLRCLTAEFGYAIGEEVLPQGVTTTAGNRGLSIKRTETQLVVNVGAAGIVIIRADTFNFTTITAANWNLIVEAS